jgi:hypothetical protein
MQAKRALASSFRFVARVSTGFSAGALALLGCSAFHEPASESLPRRDAGSDVRPEAGSAAPATPNRPAEIALTSEQARCLELDQAVCAGCHQRSGAVVLRPAGVPPAPPGTPTVGVAQCLPVPVAGKPDAGKDASAGGTPIVNPPLDPARERLLTAEQAACIGVDQVICGNCHRRHGSLVLRPLGLPPHPMGISSTELVARCCAGGDC